MPRQISPANAWCFTLNNWSEKEYEFLSSKLLDLSEKYFYIVGKEVGESGTPHLQGYIALRERKKKFRPLPTFAVSRTNTSFEPPQITNAIHFEKAKGNLRQNYLYCSKDGDFITNIPKPALTVAEATEVLEKPAIIVENNTECFVQNGAEREAAALALIKQDFDIMKDGAFPW